MDNKIPRKSMKVKERLISGILTVLKTRMYALGAMFGLGYLFWSFGLLQNGYGVLLFLASYLGMTVLPRYLIKKHFGIVEFKKEIRPQLAQALTDLKFNPHVKKQGIFDNVLFPVRLIYDRIANRNSYSYKVPQNVSAVRSALKSMGSWHGTIIVLTFLIWTVVNISISLSLTGNNSQNSFYEKMLVWCLELVCFFVIIAWSKKHKNNVMGI